MLKFEAFIAELKKPSNYILTRYFKSFLTEFHKKDWQRAQIPQIISDFIRFITVKSVPLITASYSPIIRLDSSLSLNNLQLDGTTEVEDPLAKVRMHDDEMSLEEAIRVNWLHLVQQKLYSKIFPNVQVRFEDDALKDKCQSLSRFIKLKHLLRSEDEEQSHYDSEDENERLDIDTELIDTVSGELEKMNEVKTTREKLSHILIACKMIINSMGTSEKQEQPENMEDLIDFNSDREPEIEISDVGKPPLKKKKSKIITVDEYLPVLIYILMMKYPKYLWCNCKYMELFDFEVSAGEFGYYFTNVMSALMFIKNLKAENLAIDSDWFNYELAINTTIPPSPPARDTPYTIPTITSQPSSASTLYLQQDSNITRTPISTSNSFAGFFSRLLSSNNTSVASFQTPTESSNTTPQIVRSRNSSRASASTTATTNETATGGILNMWQLSLMKIVDDVTGTSPNSSPEMNEQDRARIEQDAEEEYQLQLAMAISLSETEKPS